ncbi:glycosyltransferase family 4 protein [Arthrobacter sp. ZGTC412]|uniref:glycosyltransferase family 4 protein n=1 Tax=Arthrobacter sp. ZGTC412 TaxID=2058900 RepID=UPI000CE36FA4|nr:glycosyltransferase family 4 protein [Arthrobacter sp. ZGTC412]
MDELSMARAEVRSLPKVLHLDHSVEAGGAELALVRLVNEADGWDPIVLLPQQPGDSVGVFNGLHDDIAMEKLGPTQRPGVSAKTALRGLLDFSGQILGQALAVRRSQAFKSADVIHANTSRSSLYGAIACLGSNKKLVLHLRDHVSKESLGRVGLLAFRHVALRRADGLIGNSKSTLATATHALGRRQIRSTVIPSSIGKVRVDISPEVSEVNPLRIGMVARIDPWKGQSLLIQAFALAFPKGNEQLFFAGGCLFGHEDYLAALKSEVISLGLQERVHFLGHVDEISALIPRWDVCVQASTRPEPLGQNVLQYLAAGRAVIASNEGGPAEWVRNSENGLLFEPRNQHSLAGALQMLASDRGLLRRLQQAAVATPGLMSDSEISTAHGVIFAEMLR